MILVSNTVVGCSERQEAPEGLSVREKWRRSSVADAQRQLVAWLSACKEIEVYGRIYGC
jgi:hypothetical protein